MPKWDGLKPLPDHVLAQLLRVLMCIPRTADTRLLLVKRIDGRYTTARTTTTLCSAAGRWGASENTTTLAR
jgi:hypothetical protein